MLSERLQLRPVVIANPTSSSAGGAAYQLREHGIPFVELGTYKEEAATHEAMYERLQKDDLIIVDGGDGTNSQVINGYLSQQGLELGLNEALTVFWPGGYANDLAMQLTDGLPLLDVLQHSHEVRLHPLASRAEFDGEKVLDRIASVYIGLGGTALAANAADKLKLSSHPFIRSGLGRKAVAAAVSMREIGNAPPFTLVDTESGAVSVATDMTIVRGERIAIEGRSHARLDDGVYERIDSWPRDMTEAAWMMLKMKFGKLYGHMRAVDSFVIESTKDAFIPVHHDGDLRRIPSGSMVTVSVSPHSYRTIAPELAKNY